MTRLFRSFPVSRAAIKDAEGQHEKLMERYVYGPMRHNAWLFECEMIDRYNAAGIPEPITKPTYEEFCRR